MASPNILVLTRGATSLQYALTVVGAPSVRASGDEQNEGFVASVNPRTILSTRGTSGHRLSYIRVLRVVPHNPPPRSGIF